MTGHLRNSASNANFRSWPDCCRTVVRAEMVWWLAAQILMAEVPKHQGNGSDDGNAPPQR